MLDARAAGSAAELVDALQDHLILEGDRSEGQAAVFKRMVHDTVKERGSGPTCFKCGRAGHKVSDCWRKDGGYNPGGGSSYKPTGGGPSVNPCGETGHKSPQCTKVKPEGGFNKDVKPKPVRYIQTKYVSSHCCFKQTYTSTYLMHFRSLLISCTCSILLYTTCYNQVLHLF